MSDDDLDARTLVISRVFDAPASLLFELNSKAEHLMKWFGPAGYPVTECEADFRVGGTWRMVMTGPSGVPETPFGGTYLEIVPDRKIVYDNGFLVPGGPRMHWTITFDEGADGRTTMTLTTVFESLQVREQYINMGFREGFNMALDNLQALAAQMR